MHHLSFLLLIPTISLAVEHSVHSLILHICPPFFCHTVYPLFSSSCSFLHLSIQPSIVCLPLNHYPLLFSLFDLDLFSFTPCRSLRPNEEYLQQPEGDHEPG